MFFDIWQIILYIFITGLWAEYRNLRGISEGSRIKIEQMPTFIKQIYMKGAHDGAVSVTQLLVNHNFIKDEYIITKSDGTKSIDSKGVI